MDTDKIKIDNTTTDNNNSSVVVDNKVTTDDNNTLPTENNAIAKSNDNTDRKQIEAEGNELVLSNGSSVAIIPKHKRDEVLQHIKDNNNDSISNIISKLPKYSNYAEDGTVYPDGEPTETDTPIYFGTFLDASNLAKSRNNKQFRWNGKTYYTTQTKATADTAPVSITKSLVKNIDNNVPVENIIQPTETHEVEQPITKADNENMNNIISPTKEVPIKKVTKKAFTTSPSFEKFKSDNAHITGYKSGEKGYNGNSLSDCSGGVCRYLGESEVDSKLTLNATNIYNKYTKNNKENIIDEKDMIDGDLIYFESIDKKTPNHIAVINIDSNGTKRISDVSGYYKGYNNYDYSYVDRVRDTKFKIKAFRANK
jgi:hypothetical protein